jgi:hypothetical protein
VCLDKPLLWLLLPMHKHLTVFTGGGGHVHGHVEVSRVHVGRYSMSVGGMSQGIGRDGIV